MVKITLPDGSIKKFEKETNALEIAKSISQGLARVCIAAKVDEVLVDLQDPIKKDAKVQLITSKDEESLHILRHTTAHVFAQALLRTFPKAKITIGPAIEDGFFYDVDYELEDKDLATLEQEMQKIIKEDLEISKNFKTKDEALKFFKDNKYKQEIIKAISEGKLNEEEKQEGSLQGGKLQFYKQGEFEDLCTGPHLPKTGMIKAFKLNKITKAYWRGDSNNKQLSRVYGTAFWKKSDMEEYFEMLKEAKKRDHRIVGKQLDLFMNHEYAPGMTFFLPKGFVIYNELQKFMREQYVKYDYKEVMTPNMFNKKLWETSGHWEHYKDDMFILNSEGQEFSLKPMNCPSHCLIFKDKFRSYKELPLRIADFGALHRNELSGTLSGLTRVRKFCQDDAHIFCSMEQVDVEVQKLLELVDYVYKDVFNMTYEIELSTRPEKFMGTKQIWDKAESELATAIKKSGKEFEICEGDGAFYGPKIDFRIRDCLNRIHQTATIQLDFNLPERFELHYENNQQKQIQPVMIHRAILGSIERFMAVMIEHFAGKFPLWLSPTQVKIINVSDRNIKYCDEIKEELEKEGFRISTGYDKDTVSNKIRLSYEKDKANYMLILGDDDEKGKTISYRDRSNKTTTTDIKKFIKEIKKERENRDIKYFEKGEAKNSSPSPQQ